MSLIHWKYWEVHLVQFPTSEVETSALLIVCYMSCSWFSNVCFERIKLQLSNNEICLIPFLSTSNWTPDRPDTFVFGTTTLDYLTGMAPFPYNLN
jgi:hypothetical protein